MVSGVVLFVAIVHQEVHLAEPKRKPGMVGILEQKITHLLLKRQLFVAMATSSAKNINRNFDSIVLDVPWQPIH